VEAVSLYENHLLYIQAIIYVLLIFSFLKKTSFFTVNYKKLLFYV
jgi:hypothetical protein